MNFKTFEYEMRNYKNYLKERSELKERIDDIFYQFAGVRGVRYDKERSSPSPEMVMEIREKMEKALKKPQEELDFVNKMIERCERHLHLLPKNVQKMCRVVFVDGKSYEKAGEIFGYSKNGIKYKIRSEVEKI